MTGREVHFDFSGRRALVTGAGKGIGRVVAAQLSVSGAEVVAVSRSRADLDQLRAEIGCETIVADLEQVDEARGAAEAAGNIDLLVNNAGISVLEPFLETSVKALERIMSVNLRAVLVISQVVARGMIERGTPGAIVNVSSQSSMVGVRDHAAYCASKGALDALTRVMALELGPQGIRVNAVNPTVTLTPMGEMAWGEPAKAAPMLARIPLGRFAAPEDVSAAILYLLSDAAAMVHGVCLPVNGGFFVS